MDRSSKADATFTANFDTVITLDAPPGPRYHFWVGLEAPALGVKWERDFSTLSFWAPSQAEEAGIAQGVEHLFNEWKDSAVRAGAITKAQGRALKRIPDDPSRTRERPVSAIAQGYEFPWTTELGCLNDMCAPSDFLACSTVDVHKGVGAATPVEWRLEKGARFEAFANVLQTLEPGEVRVTREIRQGSGVFQRVFRPGDRLNLLGHVAGRGFAAIHNDRLVTLEAFWPSGPDSQPNAGELIRADKSERWMLVGQDSREGWIRPTADVLRVTGEQRTTCSDR